jgi:hypothetical protein
MYGNEFKVADPGAGRYVMYVCMYVCYVMYVCMLCMYVYTYVYDDAGIYIFGKEVKGWAWRLGTYVCMYVYTYVCMYMYG